jgi:ubiquinone/menaquinone biosynthesis C-methylase UbiE
MQKSIWSATTEVLKYTAIRPEHPPAIVESVLRFLRLKYSGPLSQAVDVGCGSGMSTRNLFGKFETILGVDLSPAMIEQANKTFSKSQPQAVFKVANAETLPVDADSVQMVLVGRAIHYFDQQAFFREVDRILVPGGVVAYYSVHFPTILIPGEVEKGHKVNSIFWEYLDSRLESFWPVNAFDGVRIGSRNRRDYYVEGIKAPFDETEIDETISYDREVTIGELARELDTYGGAVNHREVMGDKAADDMMGEFIARAKQVLTL